MTDEDTTVFELNCKNARNHLLVLLSEAENTSVIDTLTFLLKLVVVRAQVNATPPAPVQPTRKRWSGADDDFLTSAFDETLGNGMTVRDGLIAEVATRFPCRTVNSVAARLYKLKLLGKDADIPKLTETVPNGQ